MDFFLSDFFHPDTSMDLGFEHFALRAIHLVRLAHQAAGTPVFGSASLEVHRSSNNFGGSP
jgi:hypothetical protein